MPCSTVKSTSSTTPYTYYISTTFTTSNIKEGEALWLCVWIWGERKREKHGERYRNVQKERKLDANRLCTSRLSSGEL